ncbi:tail fiber protein [Synechococcus phage BUCT-ZZ01]|nr:tail fiber protein [Synechococcus phage BUCT-ZZ01]
MALITTRIVNGGVGTVLKGAPLTNEEVDNNFINLNSAKLEISGGTITGTLAVNRKVTAGNSDHPVSQATAERGMSFLVSSATITNSTTPASTTVPIVSLASVERVTLASGNSSVTYTNAATLRLHGTPIAGTNSTITNPWTLYVDNGASFFGGEVNVPDGTAAAPGLSFGTTRTTGLFSTGTSVGITTNGTTATTWDAAGNQVLVGDLAVNGGDITTTATTFNLVNATATTLNIGGAATALTIGATTGTATIRNATVAITNALTVGTTATITGDIAANGGDITTTATTFNLVNATATTVNFAGAATALTIGATTGTMTLRNATVAVTNALTVGTTATITGDLAVNGGDLTTTATTFNLLVTNATTVNFAQAATTMSIGAVTGTTTVRNTLAANALTITTNGTITGDLAVNGGDLTTTATTFNLVDTTATTINFGGAATTLNIGATTGNTNILNNANVTGNLSVTGNLTVNGTTTIVNSTVVSIDDPVFTLGGDTAPTIDDNKDRGIEFRWHNGTTAKIGFFGFDDSTGFFTFIPDATNTSEVFAGTKGTLDVTSITGSAATLTTARTITLSGDVTGSVAFDGSTNVTITTTVAPNSVALGADTTGDYIATGAVSGNGLSGSATGEGSTFTITSNATAVNTANTLVFRDASGNFSAGTITAALTGNATTATTLQTARTIAISGAVVGTATSFNGSADISIPITSVDVGNAAIAGVLAFNHGGTGTATAPVQGGVIYGASTTAYASSAAGTSGFLLRSNGTGAPTWTPNDLTSFPDSSFKKSVRAATTANITLSAPQTIDGIALVAGDRVLVKNQTTASQNGIYVVQAGAWTRSVAADSSAEIASAVVTVDSGTVNGGRLYTNLFKTTDVIGTTAMPWYEVITTLGTISLTGDVTGSGTLVNGALSIATTIAAGSVALGADTTGNYAASVAVSGNGLTITGAAGEGTAFTVNSNAVSTNTANTLVFRDASGNFSAGTITASLSGNATSATNQSGGTVSATTIAASGNTTLAGDLAVNGGDLTTTATTFNLVNATATTVNFASAATTLNIGGANTTCNMTGIFKYEATDALVTTITSAAPTMNLSVSDAFQLTATATTALAFSNPPATGRAKIVSLEITNGGNFAVTWPTNTRWAGGTAPTLTTSGVDLVVFYTDDAGANWRASVVQADSK